MYYKKNESSCKKVFVKLQQQKEGGVFAFLRIFNNDQALL